MFLSAQGYNPKKNILYQDNQSAIKMEINSRNSYTGNSRYIDIKYFWVKDQVEKKEIEIQYCPTLLMLADYFTKALQGNLFKRFRNVIMGYESINDILMDSSFPLKERVKKHVKKHVRFVSEKINNENNGKNKLQDNDKHSWADVVKYQPRKNEIIRSKENEANGLILLK